MGWWTGGLVGVLYNPLPAYPLPAYPSPVTRQPVTCLPTYPSPTYLPANPSPAYPPTRHPPTVTRLPAYPHRLPKFREFEKVAEMQHLGHEPDE